MIFLHDAENHMIIRLDKTPKRDGQTDLPWLLQQSALQAMWTCCNDTGVRHSV